MEEYESVAIWESEASGAGEPGIQFYPNCRPWVTAGGGSP